MSREIHTIPCPPKPDKEVKGNIYRALSLFAKREMEEVAKEKRKRFIRICIDPDSVVAKEIKYQTALLHEILNELRGGKSSP